MREPESGEIPFFLLLEHNEYNVEFYEKLTCLPRNCFISQRETTSIIHEACSQLLPNYLLDQILCLYPEITKIQNQNGDTIAHVICSHKQSTTDMVHTLQSHCPSLFFKKDNQGNLPLHLVNSEEHSDEIIDVLLSIYPQAIMVQNEEMNTPLTSKSIRYSSNRVKTMIHKSDVQLVRSILATTRCNTRLTATEEVFYHLQHDMSSLCHNLQTKITSSNIPKFLVQNPLLKEGIDYFFHLMSVLHYNVVEWPKSTVGVDGGSFIHNGSFWLQFPIFTKMLLHHHPEIAGQKDSNDDLPLHIVAKYNWSSCNMSCSICKKQINHGIFYWVNRHHQRCTVCQTKCKRERNCNYVPLIGCHGKYQNVTYI